MRSFSDEKLGGPLTKILWLQKIIRKSGDTARARRSSRKTREIVRKRKRYGQFAGKLADYQEKISVYLGYLVIARSTGGCFDVKSKPGAGWTDGEVLSLTQLLEK